jgi:hypothetical protein
MGLASCQIVGVAAWRVSHDGKADNVYETKKLAFVANAPKTTKRRERLAAISARSPASENQPAKKLSSHVRRNHLAGK